SIRSLVPGGDRGLRCAAARPRRRETIMTPTLRGAVWAVSVAEAANPIFKGLAILGGAAFGAFLIGAIGQFATRLLTSKKLPVWGVRTLRLLGGVVGGWLIALWVLSSGGSGPGGSGGLK